MEKHLLACQAVRENFVRNLQAYCALREKEPGISETISREDFEHA